MRCQRSHSTECGRAFIDGQTDEDAMSGRSPPAALSPSTGATHHSEAPSVYAPRDFVGIATPTLIYIGVANRAKFDSIKRSAWDSGLKPDGSHVLAKEIEQDGVAVIFQHWVSVPPLSSILAKPKIDTRPEGEGTCE